jgi:hypothetical protein
MLNLSYFEESLMENEETIERYGKYNHFVVHVYGDVVLKEFEKHVRISKSDWEKYKQRLIPVLKQGEMKHGSTETRG